MSPAEGRRFGFTVGVAFAALGAIAAWREHVSVAAVLVTLGGLLALAGWAVPGRLGPVYRGWMRVGLLISKVTTPVFMGLVFFLAILPVGVLMRLFGKNPLKHRPDGGSYWVRRSRQRGTMANQF